MNAYIEFVNYYYFNSWLGGQGSRHTGLPPEGASGTRPFKDTHGHKWTPGESGGSQESVGWNASATKGTYVCICSGIVELSILTAMTFWTELLTLGYKQTNMLPVDHYGTGHGTGRDI